MVVLAHHDLRRPVGGEDPGGEEAGDDRLGDVHTELLVQERR